MTDPDAAVYESVAAAVAGSREPDLTAFDPARVRCALQRALGAPVPRRDFLTWLDDRVRALSDGRVSVEERAVPEPPGPGTAPELAVRVVVSGEPFAEPVVLRADDRAVHYPMRGDT